MDIKSELKRLLGIVLIVTMVHLYKYLGMQGILQEGYHTMWQGVLIWISIELYVYINNTHGKSY